MNLNFDICYQTSFSFSLPSHTHWTSGPRDYPSPTISRADSGGEGYGSCNSPNDFKTTFNDYTNDTLVDTSFQLISDFFHVNQGV